MQGHNGSCELVVASHRKRWKEEDGVRYCRCYFESAKFVAGRCSDQMFLYRRTVRYVGIDVNKRKEVMTVIFI